MNVKSGFCSRNISILWFVLFLSLLLISPYSGWAQNPNSGPTTTGQILTVHIIAPVDGSVLTGQGLCQTPVQGLVTLGDLETPKINVLYVVDLSGSTGDQTNFPPIDVNSDGRIDSGDDFNDDGVAGDILDAEIAAAMALNESIGDLSQVHVGILGYASHAVAADVSPANGLQLLTSSPFADENSNDSTDVEEVLRSLDSDPRTGGSIGKFLPVDVNTLGNSTNFEEALQIVLQILTNRPEDEHKIVFFLSDGDNKVGGDIGDEIQAAANAGIVINTFGITSQSDSTELAAIAEGTGGIFKQVDDPSRLSAEITSTQPVGITSVKVNGTNVSLSAAGTFSSQVSLSGGPANIVATAIADDSTEVTANITVVCPAISLTCSVDIIAPQPGAIVCGDSVEVVAVTRSSGGVPPVERTCFINGIPVFTDDEMLKTLIPMVPGVNFVVARCTYADSLGNETACSDTVEINKPDAPSCLVKISAPAEGRVICGDSVTVVATTDFGDNPQIVAVACSVNNIPAIATATGFTATISLPADGQLIAVCTITDSCGSTATCSDTLNISRPAPPVCSVQINTPVTNLITCADTILVCAQTTVTSEESYAINCAINGAEAMPADSGFCALVALVSGQNRLIATCTVSDSCGNQVVCNDTIKVRRDGRPPYCEFTHNGQIITGTFYDPHSGIASVDAVEIRNGMLVVENFHPGAKRVDFQIEPVEPNKNLFFSIDVEDLCGNIFNCDPVFVSLQTTNNLREHNFTFPASDRYFMVENHGLDEITVELNGNRFKLLADAALVASEFNAYFIPGFGTITFDIEPFLSATNRMRLKFDGAAGTHAQIMIASESGFVDHVLDLEPLPESFQLGQNYPNPFNPRTRIQYELPSHIKNAVMVTLKIYNLLGELVQTLVKAEKLPGRYVVEWDGKNESGQTISSGIYIYRMQAGNFTATRRLLFLK